MLPTSEDAKTEFKQSFSDDVIIALVAFANSKGGKVYVGMRDNGTVCGVSYVKIKSQIIHKYELQKLAGKLEIIYYQKLKSKIWRKTNGRLYNKSSFCC